MQRGIHERSWEFKCNEYTGLLNSPGITWIHNINMHLIQVHMKDIMN